MTKRMLIDALHPEETRVVIADERQIYDFDFVSTAKKQLKGNIFLAKITRVEPSLQAAFVEYGGGKQGFLPFSEIHPDYYQIPTSDRKRLMEEAESEAATEQVNEPSASSETESIDAAPADMPMENAPATEELAEQTLSEHPAYLSQGALDIPPEETPRDESPVAENTETADANEAAIPETTEPAAGQEEKPAEEAMETLPNEEEEMRDKRNKRTFFKRYRIQEVIRRGQIVLVQVIKEERGNKGVSLTTYLSLAGRYCVLMPNSPKDGGISRKIASPEDRRRLKAISSELKFARGMSAIIRTAGMDRTSAEIKRDYEYLVKLWNRIREDTLQSNAPALIYEESNIIKRAIRDQYTGDIDELIIEGDDGYNAAKDFMKLLLPSHTPKIKHYNEPTPLFYAYNVEDQLLQMHDPVVKLRSGGYIVINPTEALISIDVNSGRATGERNIEETATKTNLEAANEVARQLRLRDLAGLIVIDFIDMLESRNRRNVERSLKDALKADRAKIQLGRISPFGLLEMSRQRLRPSISETNMVQCPHCVGRGYIRSNESMSIQIIRALEKEASTGTWSGFRLIAPQAIALHLLNTKRDALKSIEDRHTVTIQVLADAELALSDYNLEKMRRPQNQAADARKTRQPVRDAEIIDFPPIADHEEGFVAEETSFSGSTPEEIPASDTTTGHANSDRGNRGGRGGRRGRRGGRGGRKNFGDSPRPANAPEMPQPAPDQNTGSNITEVSEPSSGGTDRPERGSRPPRQRGGRGRRPWRDDNRSGNKDSRPPRHDRTENTGAVDGQTLPAFTRESAAPAPVAPPAPAPVVESTPRDPNAQPKKGWWQKMIQLDD